MTIEGTADKGTLREAVRASFTKCELAKALDDHLPRMAFRQYGEVYNDDPDFDIEAYYDRVADAIFRAALSSKDEPLDVEFDAARMTHAWAILEAHVVAKDGEAVPNPNRWEPDRYNAAAFVKALLRQYAALSKEIPA